MSQVEENLACADRSGIETLYKEELKTFSKRPMFVDCCIQFRLAVQTRTHTDGQTHETVGVCPW
ncbi:MAG: hypothetical protein U9Q79_12120 [Candidatus Hydrogenedentes bacterium]|nr:hypothetical protein [Candidatus Hydrogenedentota bacterium]